MTEHDKDEFRNAIRQIAYYSMNLENPYVFSDFGRNLLELLVLARPRRQRVMNKLWRSDRIYQSVKDVPCPMADRVRVSEWIRKLVSLDDNCENMKKKNEYIQFLRIQVTQSIIQPPFTKPPPDTELPPLPELLGNLMCEKVPGLPKPGPLTPCAVHKSPDGRAYISIKHVPGNGILCYMAVTPEPME